MENRPVVSVTGKSTAVRVGIGLAAAVAGTVLVWTLHPVLDAGSYMLFVAAVTVSAIAGGLWSGLACTALSVAAIDFFFLMPRYSLLIVAGRDVALLAVFSGLALLVNWLNERTRRLTQRQLLQSAGTAALLERQLTELERDLDASETLRRGRRPPRSGEAGA